MTREKHDTQNEKASQATFEAMVREQLQQAVRTALISVLEAEVEQIGLGHTWVCCLSEPMPIGSIAS